MKTRNKHKSVARGSLLGRVRRHDRALILAIETLALYANPESYHAVAMLCDRPSGWFADDVSKTDHPHYDRKMHGAAARKALAKIQKLVTPNATALRKIAKLEAPNDQALRPARGNEKDTNEK